MIKMDNLFSLLPEELNDIISHFLPLDKMLELVKDCNPYYVKIMEDPFYYKSRAMFKFGISCEEYDRRMNGPWSKIYTHNSYRLTKHLEVMTDYLKALGMGEIKSSEPLPIPQLMESCYEYVTDNRGRGIYADIIYGNSPSIDQRLLSTFLCRTLETGDLESFRYYFGICANGLYGRELIKSISLAVKKCDKWTELRKVGDHGSFFYCFDTNISSLCYRDHGKGLTEKIMVSCRVHPKCDNKYIIDVMWIIVSFFMSYHVKVHKNGLLYL